jgi:hypothetical protein
MIEPAYGGLFIGLHFRRFATFRRGRTAPLHANGSVARVGGELSGQLRAKQGGSASLPELAAQGERGTSLAECREAAAMQSGPCPP